MTLVSHVRPMSDKMSSEHIIEVQVYKTKANKNKKGKQR